MRFNRNILSITFLIAALAYTLWFVFAGFGNHQDPLYWLYKYEHLQGGWMAVGTLLTGGAIVHLFGAQLLPLRLFGWLCSVTAIALPYCCLLDKEQRRTNIHWLTITYVLMGYGAFQEFSPGTLTVLLLSSLWVCAVKSQIINHKFEIVAAILLGMSVAARFPNILALLILIPLWKKRCLWNIPIAALTAGIVYLLGYFFVTPAPIDAAMNSHYLVPMITKLWENGGKLVGFLFIGLAVVMLSKVRLPMKPYHVPVLGGVVGLLLLYFVIYAIKPMQWYNTDLTYLLSALIIVVSVYSYTIHRTPSILIGTILLMIATLGTDTAWLKLFPAVLCLLPVAMIAHERSTKDYFLAFFAVMAIITVGRMTTNSVGQSRLTKATTFSTVAPYQGIAIRKAEEQRLLQYKADFDSQTTNSLNPKPSTILAIGQENHLMRAVTGCEAARYNEFWSNIFDTVYTDKYREVIQAEHPIVFCSFSPQFKTKPIYQDKESAMENMLREEGYQTIDRSKYKYMIYIPPTDD